MYLHANEAQFCRHIKLDKHVILADKAPERADKNFLSTYHNASSEFLYDEIMQKQKMVMTIRFNSVQ